MAATDKHYRDQYALDIVFAVSSILMLVSVVWMFVQDYSREFKDEQRSFRDVEADLDSISSFYDIEVDEHGPGTAKAKSYFDRIQDLKKQVAEAQAAKDQIMAELKDMQANTDRYEAPLTEAISNWKKITDKFDAQVQLAINKRWGFGDFVRAFPVIDAFRPP